VVPLRIYDYLIATRQRVFDAVRDVPADQQQRSFGFGLPGGMLATLAHLMISEWYYIERLQGRRVPPYEQWPVQYQNPPALEVIERAWREQAQRVRATIAAEQRWDRTITWLGFPDDTRGNRRFHITCSAGDLFTQLALHEMHHRAQVMAMLRELGRPLADLDYNALMFQRVEAEGEAS